MAAGEIVLCLEAPADPALLEGQTFQLHVLPGCRLRLYPVEVVSGAGRCPVLVAGERCGGEAGHPGKHHWASAD
jgi:hypothetical protein